MTKINNSCTLLSFCIILALVSAGSDGQVDSSYLHKSNLSRSEMDNYPLTLIKLMTRYAEDLIWANNITKAEEIFNFTLALTEERSDASGLREGTFIDRTTIDSHI